MTKKIIKGYKGFDKDLCCRGKQYEVGKTYTEAEAELCEKGMHFCGNPHDVFSYYKAGYGNRFAIVESDNTSDERGDDSKRVAKTLSIKTELSVFDICDVAVSAFFENFGLENKIESADTNIAGDYGAARTGVCGAASAGDCGAASAGDCGAARAGDRGAARAGNNGAASAGDGGAARTGVYGAASAGFCGAASAGDGGAARAGNNGAASAGDGGAARAGNNGAASAGDGGAARAGFCGAARAGDRGAASAGFCGAASAGDGGTAIVSNNGKVKGGIGCVLVARDLHWDSLHNCKIVTDWACAIVDGDTIKADTWYHLVNGKLEEVEI